MANENKNQDDLNANELKDGEDKGNFSGKAANNETPDLRQATEGPKENPFSFKHFLRRDTSSNHTLNHSQSNANIVNGNDQPNPNGTCNGSTSNQSPSKSATTSSLNSTGARPKIPQFQSINVINQVDLKMKRSPKFSSFDSQSSLSELAADERNMHGSRSNNSFNIDYQFPSSRSYSNYDIEPSSEAFRKSPSLERRHHVGNSRGFQQRSHNNVNNSSNSVLPDFVQDHLLTEYYSDSANMSPLSGDDFSLGNSDSISHQNGSTGGRDIFGMNLSRSPNSHRRNNQPQIPLDLPSHRSTILDLPPDLMGNVASSNLAVQREETYGPHNEPEITRDQSAIDKMQTLPDFLSDFHSSGRLADVATVTHDEDTQSIVRLQQENERLRMIIVDMECQINHAKSLETQYNVTLAESMEQVEENLCASNQRATEAQALANKYKQQVKQLSLEIQHLRRENETLREGGAVGGIGSTASSSKNRHLARDLRAAASNAESNLRQLLSGVDNLRLIASSIENMEQPSSTNVEFLSDNDEFNEDP